MGSDERNEDDFDDTEDLTVVRESTDVTTGAKFNRFRSDPLGFFIRLTAESSAFVSGDGWQGYNNPIGAPIFYPEYSFEIKDALVSSPRLRETVRALALKKIAAADSEKKDAPRVRSPASMERKVKEAEGEVWKQANGMINGMIANLDSISELKALAFTIHYILVRMYHQGIHIREREFLELKKTAEYAEKNKLSLIFLPCHKSHVDYLVISYIFYRLGLALPHIAAGDNLNMPVVGHVLKHCGAFFIRRVWGDDVLYNNIMKEYIEILLRRGHNIEAFTEGTRSRIGKLLQPKFGIMKIIMEAVLSGRVNDCIIVPMSIGYDKVIETGSYVSELLGAPKEKESLYQLLSNMNILGFKWGRIDISFSKPFSMREYIASQTLRRGVVLNPKESLEDRNLMLQTLGFRVLSDINKVSVIMPTALVGTILLTLRGRGVGRNELIRKVNWLRRVIMLRGGSVADFGGQSTDWIVDRAVQVLRDLVGQRLDLLEPVFYPVKRFELSFYRNQVIHLFITEAILSCALYATVKQGGPVHVQKVRIAPDLEADCAFISRLLKTEFIYGPNGLSQNMMATLEALQKMDVLTVEEELKEDGSLSGQQWVSLSVEERRIGRETFDFFCFLLWPFLETYWLAAISCFSLIPSKRNATEPFWVEERTFLNTAQFLGKSLYYEGDLSYFEAVNKETIKNALQRLKDMGVLKYTKMKSGKENVTMVSLSPDWLPANPMPDPPNCTESSDNKTSAGGGGASGKGGLLSTLFGTSRPGSVKPLTSLDGTNAPEESYDAWHYFMPDGRLWELCEQIGRYRREGKNRRDTATVATRVLRLASVAKVDMIKVAGAGKKVRTAKLADGLFSTVPVTSLNPPSLANVVDTVFESILEQCMYEVAYEAHREDKLSKSICQICLKKCRCYVIKPAVDIYGNSPTPATMEKLKCIKCSTLFPTNRYAAHLEKCLGLGGRRAASRSVNKKGFLPNQSSPTLVDSDPEDLPSKKKRSDSPIPKHSKIDGVEVTNRSGAASSTFSRSHTHLSDHTYPPSREATPVISSAQLPRAPGSFGGKTGPGAAANARNTSGKVPVNSYGKVPRAISAAAGGAATVTIESESSDDDEFMV
ncbi:hypothetical protein HDU78_008870 [Chytriomyces hyalinus]|nr:hypothetical protein HDU78_008870 [Chytriomyces hyalinus]